MDTLTTPIDDALRAAEPGIGVDGESWTLGNYYTHKSLERTPEKSAIAQLNAAKTRAVLEAAGIHEVTFRTDKFGHRSRSIKTVGFAVLTLSGGVVTVSLELPPIQERNWPPEKRQKWLARVADTLEAAGFRTTRGYTRIELFREPPDAAVHAQLQYSRLGTEAAALGRAIRDVSSAITTLGGHRESEVAHPTELSAACLSLEVESEGLQRLWVATQTERDGIAGREPDLLARGNQIAHWKQGRS